MLLPGTFLGEDKGKGEN